MLKELFELFTNWRFWSLVIITCIPFIFGIAGGAVLYIQERRGSCNE